MSATQNCRECKASVPSGYTYCDECFRRLFYDADTVRVRDKRAGFSLLEITFLLFVIPFLAGVGVASVSEKSRKAPSAETADFEASRRTAREAQKSMDAAWSIGADDADDVMTYHSESDELTCEEGGGPALPCTLDQVKRFLRELSPVNITKLKTTGKEVKNDRRTG